MKICKCIGVPERFDDIKEGELYKYRIASYSSVGNGYNIHSYDEKYTIMLHVDEELFDLCFEDLYESRKRKIKLLDEDL